MVEEGRLYKGKTWGSRVTMASSWHESDSWRDSLDGWTTQQRRQELLSCSNYSDDCTCAWSGSLAMQGCRHRRSRL